MREIVKYLLLCLNSILVLFVYQSKIENVLVIIWGWSIWILLYYELCIVATQIFQYTHSSCTRIAAGLNLVLQLTYVFVYSYIIQESICSIKYIGVLLGIQFFKALLFGVVMLSKKAVLIKDDFNDKVDVNKIVEDVKGYLLSLIRKEDSTSYQNDGESLLIVQAGLTGLWIVYGMIISYSILQIISEQLVEYLTIFIYMTGIIILNFIIFIHSRNNRMGYTICTIGCVGAFIMFNGLQPYIQGIFPQVYFAVVLLIPELVYIRNIVSKINVVER